MNKLFAAIALASAMINPSHADAVYLTPESFLSHVQSDAYTETFSIDHDRLGSLESFSNGLYSYTISGGLGLDDNGSIISALTSSGPLLITFDPGVRVNAIGGNFFNSTGDFAYLPTSLTVRLSNGSTETFTPASFEDSYRGYITDSYITTLLINSPNTNGFTSMDNLTVGVALPVPEPSSLATMGVGILVLAAMRRSRKAGKESRPSSGRVS
jgi:hypothetical protein